MPFVSVSRSITVARFFFLYSNETLHEFTHATLRLEC